MDELNSSLRTKIIKNTFKQFNEESGFYFKTPRIILKDNYDIINFLIISITGGGGVTCDLCVQPLYIPATDFDLNISIRLEFVGNTELFPWGHYDDGSKEFEQDIEEILHLFSTGGLEWLTNFSSPQKIIETSNDWSVSKYKNIWFPVFRNETTAVSHLYIGDIEKGIYLLNKGISELPHKTESSVSRFQRWLDWTQNEEAPLPKIFDDIILTTRKNLKLKDEKCELLNKRQEEQINSILLP